MLSPLWRSYPQKIVLLERVFRPTGNMSPNTVFSHGASFLGFFRFCCSFLDRLYAWFFFFWFLIIFTLEFLAPDYYEIKTHLWSKPRSYADLCLS